MWLLFAILSAVFAALHINLIINILVRLLPVVPVSSFPVTDKTKVTTLGFTLGGSYKGIGFNMLWYSAMDVYKEAIPSYLWDFPEGNIKAQPNTLNTWTADAPIQSGPVRPSIQAEMP